MFGWGWGRWLLLLIGALFLGSYFGWVALFLFVFLLMVLAGSLGPIWRALRLPQWSLVGLLLVVMGGAAYTEHEVWLPWVLYLSGLIAQAYFSVIG